MTDTFKAPVFSALASAVVLFSPGRLFAESDCEKRPEKLPVAISKDLEEDEGFWGVYCEGEPRWAYENVREPALKGKALRCTLSGGRPYSNAHFFRDLPVAAAASRFEMEMTFTYRPASTFNDAGGEPSVVQGLEFTMNKWLGGLRYEWALQWQNVGDGAPQWRYWDPHQPGGWVPLALIEKLEGEKWHTLSIKGRIKNKKVWYDSFTINGTTHALDITVAPDNRPNDHDRLAVAIQLDGNGYPSTYDVILDNVTFKY